jgi:hypothetical protein
MEPLLAVAILGLVWLAGLLTVIWVVPALVVAAVAGAADRANDRG